MGPNIGLIGEHDHAEVSTDWFKGKKNTETTEICSANEGLSAWPIPAIKNCNSTIGLGIELHWEYTNKEGLDGTSTM